MAFKHQLFKQIPVGGTFRRVGDQYNKDCIKTTMTRARYVEDSEAVEFAMTPDTLVTADDTPRLIEMVAGNIMLLFDENRALRSEEMNYTDLAVASTDTLRGKGHAPVGVQIVLNNGRKFNIVIGEVQ